MPQQQPETSMAQAIEQAVEVGMRSPLRDPIIEGIEKADGALSTRSIPKTALLAGVSFTAGYLIGRRAAKD